MRNRYKGKRYRKVKAVNINQAVRQIVEKDRLKARKRGRKGRCI